MSTEQDPLYPLSEFYRKEGNPLPFVEFIQPSDIPEPQIKLLNHSEDMTSVLQRFHKQLIRLQVLSLFEEKDRILREVILVDENRNPVEFGAIEIHLSNFPEPAREQIRASIKPLGAIIQENSMSYISRPGRFLKVRSDSQIEGVLNLTEEQTLYGRINALSTGGNKPLASVVEILPPMKGNSE